MRSANYIVYNGDDDDDVTETEPILYKTGLYECVSKCDEISEYY
jgi:hypothetical protein